MASQAHVKKIDELEAQLHEAEDIVEELREELSLVQRQLARALPKEEVKCMVQVDEGRKENLFSCPNSFICPPPDKQQNILPDYDKDTSNIGQKLYKPLFPSLSFNDMDLPAIISRSKGTKRYRSGCSQRILACEDKNLIYDDLTTKVDESHNPEKGPSPRKEMRKIKTTASPNKKQKISSLNQKEKDRVADNSSLTTTRQELQPPVHEKSELPLHLEAEIDPHKAKPLEIDGVPIKPILTYQRRRKQGTMSTDGNDVSNKLKNTEDDKNAVLETEKVNSVQESVQEETEEVVSVEKSAKEEIPLEPISQQLISLSDRKELQ